MSSTSTQSVGAQRRAFLSNLISSSISQNRTQNTQIMQALFGNSGFLSGCTCGSSSNNQLTQLLLAYILGGFGNNTQAASSYKDCGAFGTVNNGMGEFANIDSSGNGKISRAEYQNYYMRQREMEAGEIIDKNHADYKKYKKEANNMFNALSNDGYISQKRFQKMLNVFDRHSDGTKDGYIDNTYMKASLEKIKEQGSSAEILNGKTLRQLINMEA